MADASIRITGIGTTIKRLEKVGGSFGNSLLKGAIYLRGVLATYPPRRIPSRYVRTRNLGHRWTAKLVNDRNAIVGNNATYARWVMDEEKQTRVMKARDWIPAQVQAQREKNKIIDGIRRDIQAQLRRGKI